MNIYMYRFIKMDAEIEELKKLDLTKYVFEN